MSVASFSAAYPPAMCVDLGMFDHHCVKGLARGQLLASPLSKYEEPREWPELRMKEILGVTQELESTDLEEGEAALATRHRIRDHTVLEVQASDLESMEQFKKGLPLEQGSLRQALGQAQWTDPGLRTLCRRLFQSKDDQWTEDANSFRLDGDRTLEVAVMIPGRAVAQ